MGSETPNVDKLSEGPWPSHARELKRTRYPVVMYENGMKEKITQWGHGGMSTVPGLGSGAIARKSKRPEIVEQSPLIRVLGSCGGFYHSDVFRKICEIADKYGDGSLHVHTTNSNIEVCGFKDDEGLEGATRELNKISFDVGSAGDAIRNIPDCVGEARCEHALLDTMGLRYHMMKNYLDDVQYPRFPYKIKIKISGCPNECSKAQLHGDVGIIGVFRDSPRVDQEELREWVEKGGDIERICEACPGDAMNWDGKELKIDGELCVHCMYCINRVPAIRPGEDRGVAVTLGGKMKGKFGPMKGKVLVPFVKATPPDYRELLEIFDRITEAYFEYGKKKERIGDMIHRVGWDKIMEMVGIEPGPRNIISPRRNIFYHWKEEELRR